MKKKLALSSLLIAAALFTAVTVCIVLTANNTPKVKPVPVSYKSVPPQIPEMGGNLPAHVRQLCEKLAICFGQYGMGLTLLAPTVGESGFIYLDIVTYGRDIPLPSMDTDAAYSVAFTDPDAVVERRYIRFRMGENRERDFEVDLYDPSNARHTQRDYRLLAAVMMVFDEDLEYPVAMGLVQNYFDTWQDDTINHALDAGDYRMVGDGMWGTGEPIRDQLSFVYVPDIWADAAYDPELFLFVPIEPEWVEEA